MTATPKSKGDMEMITKVNFQPLMNAIIAPLMNVVNN